MDNLTPTQGEALEALLPCPFCGCYGISTAYPRIIRGSLCGIVECHTDGCYAMVVHDTLPQAIAAWDRRAALQPNIAHAVGGVREAAEEFCNSPDAPWASNHHSSWVDPEAAFVAGASWQAAPSAPQQPVKLDAVREDHDFVCPACMCREFARVQTADLQETDDVRCVGCKRVYSLPLATPSTDTGLDPATVLDWLAENPTLELSHYRPVYGDDDDHAVEWRVHRRSGSINDREWTMIGAGETPLAALEAARGQS